MVVLLREGGITDSFPCLEQRGGRVWALRACARVLPVFRYGARSYVRLALASGGALP